MPFFARFALPALFLPLVARVVLAQPPTAPSTIKAPVVPPTIRIPVVRPDPPQISAAELQNLTGGPTFVTFSGRDLTPAEATRGLIEAARLGEPDFIWGDKTPLMTVDWKQTPFWIAAAQVEKQTGGQWEARSDGLTLEPARVRSGNDLGLGAQLAAQTPFITLVATKITRDSTRIANLGAGAPPAKASNKAQLVLNAYFDPHLPVQAGAIRGLRFQKQGEATVQLGPQRNGYDMQGSRLPGMDGDKMISPQTVYLPEGTAPGTTFSSISGVLHTVLVSAQDSFRVPDLLASPQVTKTVGANSYTFQKATVEGDQLTLHMQAAGREDGNIGRFPFDPIYGNLRVLDAKGRALSNGGISMRGLVIAPNEFIFRLKSFRGEIAPGPYSLDWPIVTQTRSLDVPFELRDVVVP